MTQPSTNHIYMYSSNQFSAWIKLYSHRCNKQCDTTEKINIIITCMSTIIVINPSGCARNFKQHTVGKVFKSQYCYLCLATKDEYSSSFFTSSTLACISWLDDKNSSRQQLVRLTASWRRSFLQLKNNMKVI